MTNFQWLAKHHGLTGYAWQILRQCEHELHRWAEMEAEGEIQWNDDDTVPLRYQRSIYGDFTESPRPVANRQACFLDEARRQAARFGLEVYHQGDCRGCSLWLYSQSELDQALERSETLRKPGMGISACYNSIGTAVC